MRIINIVSGIEPKRFGVYNAATNTASYLLKKFGISSELWYPYFKNHQIIEDIENVPLHGHSIKVLNEEIKNRNLDPKNDIIVSHCPWNFQMKWGNYLKNQGFKWIFVPHGTLEPWSLSQKKLKKYLYLLFVENKQIANADVIRAVSTPEMQNLSKKYRNNQIVLIPNGIEVTLNDYSINNKTKNNFLFLARLHHKKGIIPLADAWIKSNLHNNYKYILTIAGPDDGELYKLKQKINDNSSINIKYIGPVYGSEKVQVFQSSNYYILPSMSEGFPVSLLEALKYSNIPIITDGCNFPELFDNNLAIRTTTQSDDIKLALENIVKLKKGEIQTLNKKSFKFLVENYSLEIIGNKQYELYNSLINEANC